MKFSMIEKTSNQSALCLMHTYIQCEFFGQGHLTRRTMFHLCGGIPFLAKSCRTRSPTCLYTSAKVVIAVSLT